jgi:hypothetical protein
MNNNDTANTFVSAPGTNIQAAWRRAGWVPPSEQQAYIDKWYYYRHLADLAPVSQS